MYTIFCFNTAINPRSGLIDVVAKDTDLVTDVVRKIWDEFRGRLQEQFPKVVRSDLILVRLVRSSLSLSLYRRSSSANPDGRSNLFQWHPRTHCPFACLNTTMRRKKNSNTGKLSVQFQASQIPNAFVSSFVLSFPRLWPLSNLLCSGVQRNNLTTVEAVRDSPPASTVAASVTVFKHEQDRYILYNGRPMDPSAAPVTIYHPAFARLKDSLNKIDRGEPVSELYRDLVPRTNQLFTDACEIYDTELLREGAVVNQLGNILNLQWDLCKDIGGVGEKKAAQADAIARVDLDSGIYQQRPIAACLELKNELGVNGICEIQVAARYEKAVVQQEYAKIREASCCPSILISMAGPHIRFYGAVLADVFIVQPFTDYIFLGGDPDTESRTERVAKIFMEVRRALDELKIWYRALSSDGGEGLTAPHHILPRPSYARASDHALLSTLQFLDRFEYAGCRRKRPGKPSIYDFQRSLFRARLHGIEVLVKFCFRYGASVHRVLAEHDTPLAPKLYTCAPLVGGALMVVMDIVPGGRTAWQECSGQPLPDSVADDIELALNVLGQDGLVHGDVRRPNVMIVSRGDGKMGGMLVDFDWAGKDGEVCYPSSLNKNVNWQQGVQPAKPIRSAHDWEMWRALKRGAA